MSFPSFITGNAGRIELKTDAPATAPVGIALVCHPHPLLGGTADHKVPVTIAKALQAAGYLAVRPNFRGVGASEGEHDHGQGEVEDMLAVVALLQAEYPGLPLILAGFSFGSYVVSKVASRVAAAGQSCQSVILTGMAVGSVDSGRVYDTDAPVGRALIVHGELDEMVRLRAVMEWAAPLGRPVVVVPAADHFFSRKLPVLKAILNDHLALLEASTDHPQ